VGEGSSLPTFVIDLPYRRALAVLWTGTATVIALGLFHQAYLYFYLAEPFASRLINLDSENSLPEWWSVFQLSFAGILLFLNARVAGRSQRGSNRKDSADLRRGRISCI
jgi:hypothetical protein